MLDRIQKENKPWADRNFGNVPAWHPLLGIMEEVGELAHHFLKREQGIRMHENHDDEIRDAVGDIVIYLVDFCNREGIDLQQVVAETWSDVSKRDWINNPNHAHEEAHHGSTEADS